MNAFVTSCGQLAVSSRSSSLVPVVCTPATNLRLPIRSSRSLLSMQQLGHRQDYTPSLDVGFDQDNQTRTNEGEEFEQLDQDEYSNGTPRRAPSGRAAEGFEDAKLFVGNLSWDTTNVSLGDAFSEYGEVVDSKVVTDKLTGKSRGFGFITYADPRAASAALEHMNGQQVDGRAIRIDRANKRVGSAGPRGQAPRRNFY